MLDLKYTEIGKGTMIFPTALLCPTNTMPIKIGCDCTVHEYCVLYGNLTVGDNVRIACNTSIIPTRHTFNRIDTPIWKQPNISKGVIIEDDVLVGAKCVILDGVRIGKGSIIGAGSVVTQDTQIPPYSIAYGNPCKIKRKRFQN